MPYIAMTAAEIKNCAAMPPKIAWMACHFSTSNDGLDNLPTSLPAGSLVLLDDSIPLLHHDPKRIARQLREAVEKNRAAGILLDLQRPDPRTHQVAAAVAALDYPVAVTPAYAKNLSCAVFLPPCPPSIPLKHHLRQAAGREIWLELALSAQTLTLTPKGCHAGPGVPAKRGFKSALLCCHYSIATSADRAEFTLWRTKADVPELAAAAKALGVRHTVGLWQELK